MKVPTDGVPPIWVWKHPNGIDNGKLNMVVFGSKADYEVGVNNGEGPPVPIPNTEVKLTCADNTWLVTAWKDR